MGGRAVKHQVAPEQPHSYPPLLSCLRRGDLWSVSTPVTFMADAYVEVWKQSASRCWQVSLGLAVECGCALSISQSFYTHTRTSGKWFPMKDWDHWRPCALHQAARETHRHPWLQLSFMYGDEVSRRPNTTDSTVNGTAMTSSEPSGSDARKTADPTYPETST